MNYNQTLEWMFMQLPMYQRVGKTAYKPNLNQTIKLDNHLGNPHKSYPTIHVAGTNGKGSTCHMIASVLQAAGYKVGLYTSPHLKDFRERIRINGALCEQDFVVDFIKKHKTFFEENQLSFFEMTVGMAFQYFKEEQVDIAVIETGLGGRLDSTNIITPLVSVITSIDKDHTAILGNTLTKIASEKAGIIKKGVPVVIGERRGWLRSRFRESAIQKSSSYHQVDHRATSSETDLKGVYQKYNSRTAKLALKILKQANSFTYTEDQFTTGMRQVMNTTGLRGRYELLQENPRVIVETAHNIAGITTLVAQLKDEDYERLHIVIGMVSDKDVYAVVQLLPEEAMYYLVAPDVPRAMPVDLLSQHFKKLGLKHASFKSVSEGLSVAKSQVQPNDLIVVTGSVFVVAEVI